MTGAGRPEGAKVHISSGHTIKASSKKSQLCSEDFHRPWQPGPGCGMYGFQAWLRVVPHSILEGSQEVAQKSVPMHRIKINLKSTLISLF